MKSEQKVITIFTIVPLIVGMIIYLFFRKDNILIFDLLNFNASKNLFFELPRLINSYLTDFLWIFSFTSLMLYIWRKNLNLNNFIWIVLPLIFAIIFEFLQKQGIVNGTYDKFDILTYILGNFIAIIINLKFNKCLTIKFLQNDKN